MKITRFAKPALVSLSMGLLFGCATLMGGATQTVSFHSNPEGATVFLAGKELGKTPLSIALSSKKAGQTLAFKKDGHKTLEVPMKTKMNGLFWGNIIFGGLIGSTTDNMSGAITEYSPDKYMVTLEPSGSGRLDGPLSRSLAQKTKDFIVTGHDNIVRDLSRGNGPYLASLFKILAIPRAQQDDATTKLLALSERYDGLPEYADEVIRLYL